MLYGCTEGLVVEMMMMVSTRQGRGQHEMGVVVNMKLGVATFSHT